MTDRMADNLSVSFIVAAISLSLAWVIGVIATNVRRGQTAKRMAQIHSKLLDRSNNSGELVAYLESEAGRRIFESLTADVNEPMTRILNAVHAGLVLFLIGISLLLLRLAGAGNASADGQPWLAQVLLLTGLPISMAGVGFLASAYIGFRILSKWSIVKDPGDGK
ncbi:hypothetical protein [Bryobacter aggregatus]|uniref:hypothetical protein n=1 Tax=Bryobacter aggregatus TaxID=360054 RepID=UPI0004E183DE|nr:hypothetical protein [Bryobacter aggregatus]